MPLTPDDLKAIKERNVKRKELKRSTSPGPWEYDSFGFIHQSEAVKPEKRIGILLRPVSWFHGLQEKYGSNFLDTGFSQPKFIQAYYDAEYIIEERNSSVEDDIDALLVEVRRLQPKK
jgi:hypothetical protein